jgi:predicted metal-binding protein
MAAPTCSRCGGRRWVRYFSETTDGNFEEAFRLCSCNHKPEAQGEHAREHAREGAPSCILRIVCSFELKVLKGL